MSHAFEHLQRAALSLARSGTVKDRLVNAYREHLAVIETGQLPKELHEDFVSLQRAFLRERPLYRGDDPVHATVRKMSNDEASELACAVVRMFGTMCQQQSPRAVNGNGAAAVRPLFATEH